MTSTDHSATAADYARDLPYWVAFSRVPSVGRVRIGALEQRFGSLEAAWAASEGKLRAAGMDNGVVSAIAQTRAEIDPEEEMSRLKAQGVSALTWHADAYPRLLREVEDLPPVLYVRGELTPADARSITVIGTRNPTVYGREAAQHLASDLAKAGVTVVSGLARGIDGIAHRAALEQGGRTVAVLGSGVDVVYPPEHSRLAGEVAESGALVSEYALGTRPDSRHFPRRNRLLSGLSLGTLVVEGGEQSGALITVQNALEQNREVFCVPGSIYSPMSRLTNSLIAQGAKLVASVEDILEELHLSGAPMQPPLPQPLEADTPAEARILGTLDMEPRHVDEVSRAAELPMTEVIGTLAVLEIKGLARQVGRMNYIRSREAAGAVRLAPAPTQPGETA
ncbi:MAG: DNA-processing protein DprA [Chloroflexota bacterium]|nr:DNA-processing protein DprA [Chloroflexota bacterium]